MSIYSLITIMEPPTSPRETGTAQGWNEVALRLGEVLPCDYMSFIEKYGSGSIAGWLYVYNPFAVNKYGNLFVGAFVELAALRQIKNEFPEEVPYPLYYERGGLLPWGHTIDGDTLCWKTEGVSGDWKVVVMGRHSPREEFRMSMTQFLFEALTRKIQPRSFPLDLAARFEVNAEDEVSEAKG